MLDCWIRVDENSGLETLEINCRYGYNFLFFFFPEVESVYRFDKVSTVHVLENYKAIEL